MDENEIFLCRRNNAREGISGEIVCRTDITSRLKLRPMGLKVYINGGLLTSAWSELGNGLRLTLIMEYDGGVVYSKIRYLRK